MFFFFPQISTETLILPKELVFFVFFLASWGLPGDAQASRCGARALGMWASVVAARGLSSCGWQALELRLSSCGARA